MTSFITRRAALQALAGSLAAHVALVRRANAQPMRGRALLQSHADPHPDPRPGITAAKLPTREQLASDPDAIPVFDMVREIPQIVDGIRCNCGCADHKDYYSLLSCYEGAEAMARTCPTCQGQGKLAYRLCKSGKSLDEIRKGIDARFG